MRRTIIQRLELCTDVLHAVLESSDNGDLSLLEVIIDEYVYKLSDREIDELEDLLVNQFGED